MESNQTRSNQVIEEDNDLLDEESDTDEEDDDYEWCEDDEDEDEEDDCDVDEFDLGRLWNGSGGGGVEKNRDVLDLWRRPDYD